MLDNATTFCYRDNEDNGIYNKSYVISDTWLSRMMIRKYEDELEETGVNTAFYGPYTWLPTGEYRVTFSLTYAGKNALKSWDIGTNFGETTSGKQSLSCSSSQKIYLESDTWATNFSYNTTSRTLTYNVHTNGNPADYEFRLYFTSNLGYDLPEEGTADLSTLKAFVTSVKIESLNGNTISFDANGGTVYDSSSKTNKSTGTLTTTYWGKKRGNVSVPTKTGYSFDGWYGYNLASNSTSSRSGLKFNTNSKKVKLWKSDGTPEVTVESSYYNYTVYAQWTAKTYTVNYNANGGTGTVNSGTATYNSNYTTANNNFSRTGYTFAGWNTKADGTGTNYSAGSSFKYTNAGDITLYAKWTKNTYTVNYYVRNEQADGSWGDYWYWYSETKNYGDTYDVTAYSDDACYQKTTVSVTVDGDKNVYIDAYRKWYTVNYYVRNEQADGSWGDYWYWFSENKRYGQTYHTDGYGNDSSGPDNAEYSNICASGTVDGNKDVYMDAYRRRYTVKYSIQNENADGSWGSAWSWINDTYRYGQTYHYDGYGTDSSGPDNAIYNNICVKGTVTGNVDETIKAYRRWYSVKYYIQNEDIYGNWGNSWSWINQSFRYGQTYSFSKYGDSAEYQEVKVSGTVTGNVNETVKAAKRTYYLDLNGYYNGKWDSIAKWATCDVYINGKLAESSIGDYYNKLRYGTTYEFKNFKTKDGYKYNGNSSYSGIILSQSTGL